jgi:hypothetical protein
MHLGLQVLCKGRHYLSIPSNLYLELCPHCKQCLHLHRLLETNFSDHKLSFFGTREVALSKSSKILIRPFLSHFHFLVVVLNFFCAGFLQLVEEQRVLLTWTQEMQLVGVCSEFACFLLNQHSLYWQVSKLRHFMSTIAIYQCNASYGQATSVLNIEKNPMYVCKPAKLVGRTRIQLFWCNPAKHYL